LSLYDNNGGIPGALIDTLTGPSSFPLGDALYVYTPTTTVLLNASTTYFVVGMTSGALGESFHWRATGSTSQTGPGTIGDAPLFSGDSGASWVPGSIPGKLSVEGAVSAVPEASSVLCLGVVCVGLLGAWGVKKTMRAGQALSDNPS
jgi:hypothetical protein